MSELEDFALYLGEDHELLFERALLPYRDKQNPETGSYSQERLADYVGKSRSWVKDHATGVTDTLPLEYASDILDVTLRSRPIYLSEKPEEYIQDRHTHRNGTEMVEITPGVQETVLNMFRLKDLASMTGKNMNTLRGYRRRKNKGMPQDFWAEFIEKANHYLDYTDPSHMTVDLVDKSAYFHAHKPLEEAALAEDIWLPRIPYLIDEIEDQDRPVEEIVEEPVLNAGIEVSNRPKEEDIFEYDLHNISTPSIDTGNPELDRIADEMF